MSMEDEPRRTSTPLHQIGQELGLLSIAELNSRIALLQGEIQRLEQAISIKQASRTSAEAVFKNPS